MSKKDTKGKPQLSLIPYTALVEIAHVREFGVEKYGDDEAWYDVPTKDFLDAALRHIYKYLSGAADDPESGRSHIAHAATSLVLALSIEQEDRYFDKYVNDRLDKRAMEKMAEQERIDYIMKAFDEDTGYDPIDHEEIEDWLNIEDYIAEINKKKSVGGELKNDLTDHLKGETLELDERFEQERIESLVGNRECKCKHTCPTHLFNGA